MSFKTFFIEITNTCYVEFFLWEFYRYMAPYLILWWILYNIEKQREILNSTYNDHFVMSCMSPVIRYFLKSQSIKIPFEMYKWQCYTYNAFFRVYITIKIISRDKPVFTSQKVKTCNSISFQIITTSLCFKINRYLFLYEESCTYTIVCGNDQIGGGVLLKGGWKVVQ